MKDMILENAGNASQAGKDHGGEILKIAEIRNTKPLLFKPASYRRRHLYIVSRKVRLSRKKRFCYTNKIIC